MKNLQVTEKVQLSVGLKFTFMGVDLSSYYKKTADGYQIFLAPANDSVKFCLKMLFLNIESKKNGETEEKTVEYALSLQINAEGLIPKEIKIFQIDSLSFNIWNTQRQTVLEKMALITPDSF